MRNGRSEAKAMQEISELQILYRDERLLAVNKPAGMVVHRRWARDKITVYDIVRDQIIGAPVHALHRLDRGTSGVLLFGLDSEIARFVQMQFEDGTARKAYLALVRGPMRDACVLDHAIIQREKDERVDAITEFTPIAHADRWSLVEARPITGRTHQIRLHLKHLSHPIIGDVRYGKGDVNRFFRENYNLQRMALHCKSLVVRKLDGCELALSAPLPADLYELFQRMGISF